MKLILLVGVVLAITGCASAHKTYTSYEFKHDGSQKAKECEFACKNQETQCKQLAIIGYDSSINAPASPIVKAYRADTLDFIKDADIRICEDQTLICFMDICGGTVKEIVRDENRHQISDRVLNKSATNKPVVEKAPAIQPIPVAKPVIETTTPTYQSYKQPKSKQPVNDLNDCRYLETDYAIAECVRGK
jgi:hypothetical protein